MKVDEGEDISGGSLAIYTYGMESETGQVPRQLHKKNPDLEKQDGDRGEFV